MTVTFTPKEANSIESYLTELENEIHVPEKAYLAQPLLTVLNKVYAQRTGTAQKDGSTKAGTR